MEEKTDFLTSKERERAEKICLRLLEFEGEEVHLKLEDLFWVIEKSMNVIKSQSISLELEAPIRIVGDIHGQYDDLLRIFSVGSFPPQSTYLFLGDYVDRGANSLECLTILLALKVLYPNHIHLLRGNHECESINSVYGFMKECQNRYNLSLYRKFCTLFLYFPLAATISKKIFCIHGGLSPHLKSVNEISKIQRPVVVQHEGIVTDFLWSDPDADITGFLKSDRGVSYNFGADVVSKFLKENNMDLIVRAHQVVEDGYEFFAERKLVTIFSASNYCGEFDNAGGIMHIDEDLFCTFEILKPLKEIQYTAAAPINTPLID